MIVLAINDGHDAGACLFRDGRLLLYSAEERRNNLKNFAGVPVLSIADVFARTGISPADVALVALSSRIRTTVPTRGHKPIYSVLGWLTYFAATDWGTRFGRWLLPQMRKRKELVEALAAQGIKNAPVVAFDHHQCHAATAYYHRPWQDAATVLTLDGAGDGICASVSTGRDLALETLSITPKYHSPAAQLYSAITAHLGLRPYEHEYKIMGMAPYGQAEYCRALFAGTFSVQGLQFRNHTGHMGAGVVNYFDRRLRQQRFDNVSAACQELFERLMVEWTRNAIKSTGIDKVVAAGGAFLNVKANKLIREMPEVKALYVYPAADDGGTSIGAGILGHLQLCRDAGKQVPLDLPKHMYLGPSFNDAACERAVQGRQLICRKMIDPAEDVAKLLAAGKIVARFAGGEEAGPRALGNRSILADPRDLRMIRKLNFAIKQRDFWMPFAGSVRVESAPRYIRNLSAWPYYMVEAFDTTPAGLRDLCAAVHPFDETIRPQVVTPELNPGYHALLSAFERLTGVGGVLNTSFNLHGSPIVGTPAVALDTLERSALDAVALGSFLVSKVELPV